MLFFLRGRAINSEYSVLGNNGGVGKTREFRELRKSFMCGVRKGLGFEVRRLFEFVFWLYYGF